MKRSLPWIGAALSILVALASAGAFLASANTAASAEDTLDNARRLAAARTDVTEAQEAIGESDLESAVVSAREANATALRVGNVTDRIARLLETTDALAAAITGASQRGVLSTQVTRRQSQLAARIIAWIAGYQRDSARFSEVNNRALRRSLAALRETNRSFPGFD